MEVPNVILRSHVHIHTLVEDVDYMGMTLPALQAMGCKFGRKLSGHCHHGIVWFDCKEDGTYVWDRDIKLIQAEQQKIIEV